MHINGNVADFILAQLAEWGVKRIYGVLGDAIFPLLDAVTRQDKIKFIAATHEANAAFMASYEARLTSKLTVCVATSGPGAVNLLNGLAEAYLYGSPVLAITGQVEIKKMGAGTKQYFEQQSLFRTFAEHTSILIDPGSVTDLLVTAVRKAYFNSSVTHISVPKDVFTRAVSADTSPAGSVEIKEQPYASSNPENFLSTIRGFQRPLIVVGQSAKTVKEQVVKLAYKLGAGLIVAQEAKGIIGGEHELNIGGVGEAYVPPVVQETDCIILIGNASYEQPFFPKNVKVVQINDHPKNIHKNAFDAIVGDLNLIVEALLQGLEGHALNQDWLSRLKEEAQHNKQVLSAELENNTKPIHPLRLMAALNHLVPKEAIITLDVGEFTHWFDRGFLGEQQEVLLSSMWRSIGCGLPAAIGAKLACPEKAVIAVVGDGGLILSMSELLTCVRYNLAITIIVVKNNIYSIEKNKMIAEGLTPFGYELTTPDFVQFAKSCGAEGFCIDDPRDIYNISRLALDLGKPVLLEVICAAVDLPNAKTL